MLCFLLRMANCIRTLKYCLAWGNAGVVEIRENDVSGTYRLIYTVDMGEYLFVLHAFQKKSKSGVSTPKNELAMIMKRLKEAKMLHKKFKERQNEQP